MTSFASLPLNIGLPSELQVADIDPIVPVETKVNSIRVLATNNTTVTGTFGTGTGSAVSAIVPDQQFPQVAVNFDIPTQSSPSAWIDTRMSTLSFRCTVTVGGTAGTTGVTIANLRSSGYSWFDNLRITGSAGGVIEDIPEYGLAVDTMLQGQLDIAAREGQGMSLGFHSSYTGMNNLGHSIAALVGAPLTANYTQSFNYSLPLISGVLGVTNSKFLPIGIIRKLLLTLTTTSVLPITLQTSAGVGTNTPFTVTLSDFWLNLEQIDIGSSAMATIINSLHNGKIYLPNQTYKTVGFTIPQGSVGGSSYPLGLTASSCKSIFARFSEAGTASTSTSVWGKYNSTNPNINQLGWSIGGINVPSFFYNPLLYPAQCFRSYLMALGSFNSTQFRSSIAQGYYQRLASNGTFSLFNSSSTQDAGWAAGSSTLFCPAFIVGEDLESIPRRGLIGNGKDLTFSKVAMYIATSNATLNPINVYVTGLIDSVCIVDVNSGDIFSIT